MPQLVGQMCVICHARIGSVLEGQFCSACGCPIHVACVKDSARKGKDICSTCGAPTSEDAPRKEVIQAAGRRTSEQRQQLGVTVLRYVLGSLLFCGFVVFVTPAKLAIVVSTADGTGDPVGLLQFGLTAALVFGIPGYFLFPYQRRFQAIAWLVFACMAYSLMLFGVIALIQANQEMLSTPESRVAIQKLTVHYSRLGAIVGIELIVWAYLFLKKRG